jgi:hypothetical protein
MLMPSGSDMRSRESPEASRELGAAVADADELIDKAHAPGISQRAIAIRRLAAPFENKLFSLQRAQHRPAEGPFERPSAIAMSSEFGD